MWVNVALGEWWDDVVVFDRDSIEIVRTLQPEKRSIHHEFTKDTKYVYIGCWNEDKVVVYGTDTLKVVADLEAKTPTGIFNAGIRQGVPRT